MVIQLQRYHLNHDRISSHWGYKESGSSINQRISLRNEISSDSYVTQAISFCETYFPKLQKLNMYCRVHEKSWSKERTYRCLAHSQSHYGSTKLKQQRTKILNKSSWSHGIRLNSWPLQWIHHSWMSFQVSCKLLQWKIILKYNL